MHKTALLTIASCVAVSASALAQVGVGFTYNISVGATSRGPAAERACQLLAHFETDDYRGFGVAQGTSLTANDITGMQFILQDQYALAGSQEQYDIRFYGEDITTPTPNYPNFLSTQPVGTNELAHFGPYTSPVGGTAADPRAAWFFTVTFTTPLGLPNNQDTFCAVELQASFANNTAMVPPFWPNDGLSAQISLGAQPGAAFLVYDVRGPGLVSGGATGNSYGLVHDVTNSSFAYGGARQMFLELMVPTGSYRGVCTTVTNQTSYTISNVVPGTASFYSGLHPDVNGLSTPGRLDNFGYTFLGAAAGQFVIFGVDFSFGTPELALSNFVAGSTGVLCLTPGFQVASFQIAAGTGVDWYILNLSPAARVLATGFGIVWQGFSFDATAGVIHSGACGQQHL